MRLPRVVRHVLGLRTQPTPSIHPRSDWTSVPASGPLIPEDEVLFLLVHHTSGSAGSVPGDIPGILEATREYHMSPEKGWPDIAYNFLIDQWGGIWEGRTGSLAAAQAGTSLPRGDATGGSQGHALLACWLGAFHTSPPTAAAQEAMITLLGWLAPKYGVDVAPGAAVSFTSRGSSKWPAGTLVTTLTIAGHRDMSETTCPGDAGYPVVLDFQKRVTNLIG